MAIRQSTIPTIFNNLQRFPLLTKDEELHLAVLVQSGRSPDATPRQKAAARRAKDRMINANMRLVISQTKRYTVDGFSALGYDDLFQEGVLGLARAVEMYDPTRGYKFSTYAYWWIRQGLSRAIQAYSTTIRVSSHVYELRRKIKTWMLEYQQYHHQAPTRHEIAQQFNLSLAELSLILSCVTRPVSLDGPTGNNEDSCLHEVIASDSSNDIADFDQFDYERLQVCVSLLKPDHRTVIERTCLADEPESLAAVAKDLKVSRERVRQMKMTAMRRIRDYLGRYDAGQVTAS